MLLKRHCFTKMELVLVVAMLVAMACILVPELLSLKGMSGHDMGCAGRLKQIGIAMLMYTGDHHDTTDQCSYGGWLPAHHQNGGNSFEPLVELGYMQNGKVWSCPMRTEVLTTAANSAYIYIRSGLKDTDPQPAFTSLAHDRPENHPDGWTNVLFIDGHVEGGYPGKAPFRPAR